MRRAKVKMNAWRTPIVGNDMMINDYWAVDGSTDSFARTIKRRISLEM